MDLLAKTIIMPPKLILNGEYLSHNFKCYSYQYLLTNCLHKIVM